MIDAPLEILESIRCCGRFFGAIQDLVTVLGASIVAILFAGTNAAGTNPSNQPLAQKSRTKTGQTNLGKH